MAFDNLNNTRIKIEEASKRIDDYISKTRLACSSWLKEESQANVYLKLESEQVTNSFKVRGASNAILSRLGERIASMGQETKELKFITASSGNHGLACSYVMSRVGTPHNLTVYVASSADKVKIKAIQRYGAQVVVHGSDCADAEQEARRMAKEVSLHYISPYNDSQVVIGQGTIGKEIYDCLPTVDAVFVPVGGGGLISGIALYLKSQNPRIQMIGCQPMNSRVMYESIKAGEILDLESQETLSNGTAGGIEPGSVTFEVCQKLVDDWILVTEEEIEFAVYKLLEEESKTIKSFHSVKYSAFVVPEKKIRLPATYKIERKDDFVIEGAAGTAVAGFLKTKERWKGKNVVLIICGGNIAASTIQGILNKQISEI